MGRLLGSVQETAGPRDRDGHCLGAQSGVRRLIKCEHGMALLVGTSAPFGQAWAGCNRISTAICTAAIVRVLSVGLLQTNIMEHTRLCAPSRAGYPLLSARPFRLAAARARPRARRPEYSRLRHPGIVCQAAAAISLDAEDDPRALIEGTSKTRPEKLPEPPKGTSLFAVLPYLCQLATADRCETLCPQKEIITGVV